MTRTIQIIGACLLTGLAFTVGMFVAGDPVRQPGNTEATANENHGDAYVCPMHPFISKARPGSCPICGMSLVKKSGADAGRDKLPPAGQVVLTPDQLVLAEVATTAAAIMPLHKKIAATGIVTFKQSRQAKVTAWVEGKITRLFAAEEGAKVRAGVPVAELTSPELVYAQEEYLLAWKAQRQFITSPQAAFTNSSEALMFAARDRLRLLGFKGAQFAQLERSERPTVRIPVYAPFSGVVTEKNVMEGNYVKVGDPLLTIADLSVVWVNADVHENELALVRPGQTVAIVPRSYPDETLTGSVSFIHPLLDSKTRTVKVRIELANPGLRLKPDMFVKATILVPLGDCLTVPVSAVMDTGMRKVVWVESAPGKFEARQVRVGVRTENHVQILSGLKPGDKVASTGGYLIDSESQLKGSEELHRGSLDMSDMTME
jgi:membrane fusion protein, copper/silver efflux system